ncbi:MAG: MFS transporter [Thermoplasmata archaeon]|nr:MFS transporter [Thermoplasmata archaeon]
MQVIPGGDKIANSKMLKGMFKAYSEFSINIKLLIMLSFAGGIGGGMTWFMVSLYMQSVGFSLQNIGWVGGLGGLATTLTYLATPFIGNTIGKKNTLYIGYGMVILSAVLLLIMVNLPLYILSGIVGGIGSALAGPTFVTVLSNMCSKKISKYAFSFQSFSQQIGMALGTVMGGVLPAGIMQIFSLSISQGFWWSIVISVIINSTQLLVLFFTRVENGVKLAHFSFKIKEPKLIGKFAVTQMLIGLGAGLVIPWFPIFFTNKYFLPHYPDFDTAYGVALPQVSTIMTISSVIMSFSFLVAPFFAERLGQVKLIAGSQAISVLFLFLIPFSPFFGLAALLYIVRTILMMVSSPIGTSFMMTTVKPEDKTNANAITMFAWNASWSFSYFISGYVWEIFPDYVPFVLCSTFYLSSCVLYFVFFSGLEKRDGGKA